MTQDRKQPPQGLRERKKARTRAAIQQHALRLFREQGYEATTMEQVADAAEVSPSTLFRYFPTKEELVLTGEHHDPLILGALRLQPRDLEPIKAVRQALRAEFGSISAGELARFRERQRLAFTVPQLRAASLSRLTASIQTLAEVLAERAGRQPGDLAIRTLAGALVGVILSAMLHWAKHPDADLGRSLDEALAKLQAGFRA